MRNFLRDPRGRYTIIDPPGSFPDEEAVDVNNRGEIVGFVDDNGENSAGTRGFLRSRQGRYVTIQVPGAVSTAALKVNDHGQVAGFYVDRANAVHGFLWDDREVTTIDHPGAEATFPFGINNWGDSVGVYYLADGSFHGFLRTPQGRFTTIDAPGAELGTQVASINDRGEMVGVAVHADFSTDGFFRGRWGRFTTIQAPGAATYTRALDINDGGDIVGDYDTRPANAGSTSAPRTRAADHSPAVRPVTAPGPRTR